MSLFGAGMLGVAALPDSSTVDFLVPAGQSLFQIPLQGFQNGHVAISWLVTSGGAVQMDLVDEQGFLVFLSGGGYPVVLATGGGRSGAVEYTFAYAGTFRLLVHPVSPQSDTAGNATFVTSGLNVPAAGVGLVVLSFGVMALALGYMVWADRVPKRRRVRRATVCPTCAAIPAPGARFCQDCGADLRIRGGPPPPEGPGAA